jgi:hypothetical protein
LIISFSTLIYITTVKERFMRTCSVDGCDQKHRSKGYCKLHADRIRRNGSVERNGSIVALPRGGSQPKHIGCSVERCDRPHSSLGYCALHWKRFHLYGDPYYTQNGPRGKGSINSMGYRTFWIDGKVMKEHTIVMEEKLGRKLLPNENIHHINGVKDDNRPENLELWVKSQPSGQRATDLVKWAKEILALYDNG